MKTAGSAFIQDCAAVVLGNDAFFVQFCEIAPNGRLGKVEHLCEFSHGDIGIILKRFDYLLVPFAYQHFDHPLIILVDRVIIL